MTEKKLQSELLYCLDGWRSGVRNKVDPVCLKQQSLLSYIHIHLLSILKLYNILQNKSLSVEVAFEHKPPGQFEKPPVGPV